MRIGRVLALLVLWTFVSSACGFSSDRAVTVLNCQGLVVTAGFWNSHIHLLSPVVLHADKRSPDEISSQTGPDADPVGFYDRVRHCFGARQHQQHPASNRKGRGVWAANCDPAKDVTAFAKVHQVIRGGKLIYPASLAKELRGFQRRQFQSSRPCLGFNHSLLRLSGFFAEPFPKRTQTF